MVRWLGSWVDPGHRRLLRELEREQSMLLMEGRSAAEAREQLRELYEGGMVVPHRVRWWQRVAVVERVAVVVLRLMAVFCLVCVVLGLAWGFWLNAVLSGLGGVAFWVWASEVRDGRVES